MIANQKGQRLVAFGRYAGIVGAYNGVRTYGLKYGLFNLPKASALKDQQHLVSELQKIELPNIRIVLTGKGRVGNGAKEILVAMGLKEIGVDDYLTKDYEQPVFLSNRCFGLQSKKRRSKRAYARFF